MVAARPATRGFSCTLIRCHRLRYAECSNMSLILCAMWPVPIRIRILQILFPTPLLDGAPRWPGLWKFAANTIDVMSNK
jgi:hypothetical protein